ncbi:hypothetical protein Q7C_1143 [Methylophaga frappieri]|uniref:Retropepsin-like aspartic endopeptidase domain-containing protein n=2 Tax=Methylophaga frappieri (strain ATCC BAA-2434 / DSM 25690 / JAM7) TaxID=754477 RepID=I1YHA5_METFJ|nr:hypothetical protein Q7C_1143 [Methylophaga frappieri]
MLYPGGIEVPARIDTGATTNSLYGINTREIQKNGTRYLRFTFIDHHGDTHEMTQPLLDEITVVQASGEQTRYVVEMGLCVGNYFEKTRFTVADRSRMTFPVLVGRNYLDNTLLVSSSEKNTVTPNCDDQLALQD